MRVLLVEPPVRFLERRGALCRVLPLGLASLAAVLRDRHDVALLLPDVRDDVADDPWGEVLGAVSAFGPDVVGVTSTTAAWGGARELIRRLHRARPDVPIVVGGPHVTASADEAARLDGVAAVVEGEGEEALPALLGELERSSKGRTAAPWTVRGVVARGADGVVHRGPPARPVEDLDQLPPPARDLLLWDPGPVPSFRSGLISMRGCAFRCAYCAVPAGPGGRVRFRSPSSVADELATLVERWGVSYAFFQDSVFTLDRHRTLALCDAIEGSRTRVPFAIQTRADRLDGELLDRLASVGLHQVFLGIESGDEESLRRIGKRTSLEDVRGAVTLVKERGLRCTGFFMVGFPWEGTAEILRTCEFACGLGLDAVSLFSATPLPGTELARLAGPIEASRIGDFRGPGLNLTALPDAEYAALFDRVAERFATYNARQAGTA